MPETTPKAEEGSGAVNWFKLAYQFGIPSAIAVFLVWSMVSRFDKQLTAVHEDLSLHRLDTAYMIKYSQESRQILLRICINTADTDGERRACLQAE